MFKEFISVFLLSKLLGKERTMRLSKATKKYTTKIAALIFLFLAIFHTLRFPLGFNINIAAWDVPLWVSIIIVIISAYLAFRLRKIK